MPNTTNTLIANISAQEDSSNAVDINRSMGNLAFDSTVASFVTYRLIVAGAINIPMPKAICTQVYIKNIDTAANVVVNWIPNGYIATNVATLNPGDVLIFWANPLGVANPGITSFSLTASANCLIEYFFGG